MDKQAIVVTQDTLDGPLPPASEPTAIYVQFSAIGTIRKWDPKPFDGGRMFAAVSDDPLHSYQYHPGEWA